MRNFLYSTVNMFVPPEKERKKKEKKRKKERVDNGTEKERVDSGTEPGIPTYQTIGEGKLLKIEPLELRFTFERKKQISSYLYLSNLTEKCVAFKVLTSNVTNYCVRPITGIILPQTTCGITVTMKAQKEPPTGMQCKDKFKIQSVVASPCADVTYVTKNMFNKEEEHFIEECKLPVVYLSAALPLSQMSPMEMFNVEPEEVKFPFEENKQISSSIHLSNMTENYVAFKMSPMELFNVEPEEVKFPFEKNKQISSSIHLSNMTENYVAFKVMTTDWKNYCVQANRGVMEPHSTSVITVTMRARKAPPDSKHKDKFLIRSAVVSPTTTEKDIPWETFVEEGLVKDIKLIAVHTFPPQAAFPDGDGSDAGSSKRASLMHNDSSDISQESTRHEKGNLLAITSIFGKIANVLGLTSRSYDGYQKLADR